MPVALTFSLRTDATQSMDVVGSQVEKALGCSLAGGDFAGGPALVGEVLGMQIGLLPWRGLGGVHTYQLHGIPPRLPSRARWEEIRIDPAILDLLERCGAHGWRIPSVEERKAEGRYNDDDA
ncbi:MAG TPA: hypothetical protein VEX86_07775 [Longimicrobium sp.]|nr:hypothetical protein [Longimicrobium sp.]